MMLKTTIGGEITVDCCIYNASGPRTTTIEALLRIAQSRSGIVLSKSATLRKLNGNPLPRFINKVKLGTYCDGSINSEGLPNSGIAYYVSEGAQRSIAECGKPYIVSLSGLSLNDNLEMLDIVHEAVKRPPGGIAGIELNLACPNVPGKPIIAYDFEQMEQVLKAIVAHPIFNPSASGLSRDMVLGVKLAPYFDAPYFQKAADIICQHRQIRFIVAINTVGNGLFVDADSECESIAPKNGLGGLGGGFVKHTALANVRNHYKALRERGRDDIDIIGVGGVASGKDAFELILCGAKAVQVGTCHWTEGASCFERISSELEAIMKKKGYSSIEDFRGNLRAYAKPTKKPPTVGGESKDDVEDPAVRDVGSNNIRGTQLQILYAIIFVLAIVIAVLLGMIHKGHQ